MHVLFFTYDVPYPANSGGKTRALSLIKAAGQGVTYTLFTFTRPGFDLSNVDELKKLGIKTIELFPRNSVKHIRSVGAALSNKKSIFSSLYFDKNIEKTLHEYIKDQKVDIVHFESFYTGYYLSKKISEMGVKQVFGSENIEYKVYEEMLPRSNPLLRPFIKREVGKIEREEREMAYLADVTIAVTQKEADYFNKVSKKQSVVIENGVSMESFPKVVPTSHPKFRILFIGNFSYFPNVDGLKHFVKDVFQKLDPKIYELIVVGRGAQNFDFLRNTSIQTIEYVPDVYDAYAMTDIFVSPIRIGGGTNFKVLEAMAAGLPVVAYMEKTSNMGFTNGHDILQVETPDDFAKEIERLRKERKTGEKIGANARITVAKHYSWKEIGKKLHILWRELHETN